MVLLVIGAHLAGSADQPSFLIAGGFQVADLW